ncbi:MAG TPA: hypothetical protein VM223_18125 [Planctomycetota bacterium]|nr:hypothetical protein [Planctomycetota bacterium]
MARKKRHLFLLTKMQGGGTLSPGEMRELERYEDAGKAAPADTGPGICHTQQELADYFEVEARTVRNWGRGRTPCPRERDGSYSIKAVTEWYNNRRGHRGGTAPTVSQETDPDYWDMRYRRAKALMAEDQLAMRRGELGRLDAWRREYGRQLQAGIYRLRGLGAKLAAGLLGLQPHEVKALIDANTNEIELELLGNTLAPGTADESSIHHKGTKGTKKKGRKK